ncbi:MAG: Rrf2 family transcriptional regulator [Opitutales bacterium]|nr:Rrf2 family transcriptional regulator [Opitutales bacterium]
MLSLSQTAGYVIVAMAELNPPEGPPRLVKEVAKDAGIPAAYLSKIVHQLGESGLLISRRGRNGGITLARSPDDINLLQICEAVEGQEWLGRCLLGLEICSDERACPTHEFWKPLREKVRSRLAELTLADIMRFEGKAWRTQLNLPFLVDGSELAAKKRVAVGR